MSRRHRKDGKVVVRVASCNVPESRKRGLDQDRQQRARKVVRWLNRAGVDVAAVQESGTYLREEVSRRDGWQCFYAPPNDFVKGRQIGNGQLARLRVKMLGAEWLSSRRTGRRRGQPKHLSVTAVGYDLDFAKFVVIGVHRQTRRSDPLGRARRAMDCEIGSYARKLRALGIPHMIVGDINDGRRWAKQFGWMKTAIQHGVDVILVSRDIDVVSTRVDRQPDISDHHFITADLAVPTWKE